MPPPSDFSTVEECLEFKQIGSVVSTLLLGRPNDRYKIVDIFNDRHYGGDFGVKVKPINGSSLPLLHTYGASWFRLVETKPVNDDVEGPEILFAKALLLIEPNRNALERQDWLGLVLDIQSYINKYHFNARKFRDALVENGNDTEATT